MNNKFLETVINNRGILDQLFIIDNHRMNDHLDEKKFIDDLQMLSIDKSYRFEYQNNILVIYDGNPYQTFLILNSLASASNIILFPSYSYLGVNKFLVNCFQINYSDCCLSNEKNYNKYLHTQQVFEKVYIVGSYQEYLEIKNDFNDAIWIESAF